MLRRHYTINTKPSCDRVVLTWSCDAIARNDRVNSCIASSPKGRPRRTAGPRWRPPPATCGSRFTMRREARKEASAGVASCALAAPASTPKCRLGASPVRMRGPYQHREPLGVGDVDQPDDAGDIAGQAAGDCQRVAA